MNKISMFWLMCCGISLCYAMENNELVAEKKIGIFSEINQEQEQQDFFYHGTVDGGKLYAVYDGKGSEVSRFLAQNFHDYFSKASGTIQERMITTCKNIDNDEFVKKNKACGSTAAIVFIKGNKAHCLHVGNSRIVLEKDGKIDFFTYDHVPNRADEYIRIEDAKGLVINNRVNGFISVSRAFGHHWLDKRLIIAEPEYEEISLTDQHKFLMLATKGLWKVMTNEEVALFLRTRRLGLHDMNSFAKLFGLLAIIRGSQDNITVMLVDLLS